MFTDASSKDSALAGTVCSLATSKDIRIYPILLGTCSSSINPSYIREANESGGQLFSLSSNEAGSIIQLADFIVRSNAVNLLLINDTLNGISRSYCPSGFNDDPHRLFHQWHHFRRRKAPHGRCSTSVGSRRQIALP